MSSVYEILYNKTRNECSNRDEVIAMVEYCLGFVSTTGLKYMCYEVDNSEYEKVIPITELIDISTDHIMGFVSDKNYRDGYLKSYEEYLDIKNREDDDDFDYIYTDGIIEVVSDKKINCLKSYQEYPIDEDNGENCEDSEEFDYICYYPIIFGDCIDILRCINTDGQDILGERLCHAFALFIKEYEQKE